MSTVNERILVVDDEPIVTEVVERYLLRDGYRVTLARDGEAGLAAARREAPDLIVLDLMLPKMDGLEVCRTLRRESKVPIIILSAKDEESDKILGLGHGDMRINPRARAVEIAGRPIDLTAKEFDLLYFLARHPGQVFSREQLLDQVWYWAYAGDASTVTVHVRRLR